MCWRKAWPISCRISGRWFQHQPVRGFCNAWLGVRTAWLATGSCPWAEEIQWFQWHSSSMPPALPHLNPTIADWITLDLHYCCLFFLMISIDIPFYGVSSRFQLASTFLSMTASMFLIDGAGCSNFMVIKDDKGRWCWLDVVHRLPQGKDLLSIKGLSDQKVAAGLRWPVTAHPAENRQKFMQFDICIYYIYIDILYIQYISIYVLHLSLVGWLEQISGTRGSFSTSIVVLWDVLGRGLVASVGRGQDHRSCQKVQRGRFCDLHSAGQQLGAAGASWDVGKYSGWWF